MGKGLVTDTSLAAIADSIRAKNGESTKYKPSDMATAIDNLPSGGAAPSNAILVDLPPDSTASEVVAGDLISVSASANVLRDSVPTSSIPKASYVRRGYSRVTGSSGISYLSHYGTNNSYGQIVLLYNGHAPSYNNYAIANHQVSTSSNTASFSSVALTSSLIIGRASNSTTSTALVVANTASHRSKVATPSRLSATEINDICRISDTTALCVCKASSQYQVSLLSVDDLSISAGTKVSLGLSNTTAVPRVIELNENLAVVIQTTSSKTIFVPVVISSGDITIGTALETADANETGHALDDNSIIVTQNGTSNYSLAKYAVSASGVVAGTKYSVGSDKSRPTYGQLIVLGDCAYCCGNYQVDAIAISGSTFSLLNTSERMSSPGLALVKRNSTSFYCQNQLAYYFSLNTYFGLTQFTASSGGISQMYRYDSTHTLEITGYAAITSTRAICNYSISCSVYADSSTTTTGSTYCSFLAIVNPTNYNTLVQPSTNEYIAYARAYDISTVGGACYALGNDRVLVSYRGGNDQRIRLDIYNYSDGTISLVDSVEITDSVSITTGSRPPSLLVMDNTHAVLAYNKSSKICCRLISIDGSGNITVGEEVQSTQASPTNVEPYGCVIGDSVFLLSGKTISQYDILNGQMTLKGVYTISTSIYRTLAILNVSSRLTLVCQVANGGNLFIGGLTLDDIENTASWSADLELPYINDVSRVALGYDLNGYAILSGKLTSDNSTIIFIYIKYFNGQYISVQCFVGGMSYTYSYPNVTCQDGLNPIVRAGSTIIRFTTPLSVFSPQSTTLHSPNSVAKTGYVDSSTNISAYLFDA